MAASWAVTEAVGQLMSVCAYAVVDSRVGRGIPSCGWSLRPQRSPALRVSWWSAGTSVAVRGLYETDSRRMTQLCD